MAPTSATNGAVEERPGELAREASFRSAVSDVAQLTESNGINSEKQDGSVPSASVMSENGKAAPDQESWCLPPTKPLKTPIPSPMPESKPPARAQLTAEQEAKYRNVFEEVSKWTTIPATTQKGAPQSPLKDGERMWLTRECMLRYLRAAKWQVPHALQRLQSTLSWRREYGADTFTFDYISPENETGKQLIVGYDRQARPILILNPGNQNTDMSDRQIHHLCFMLDRTMELLPPGQENTNLLINFQGAGSGKIPTVNQARQVLNILQSHNPERLGRALVSHTPWYVNAFFKLIRAFIDPDTREKIKFNENLENHIPPEHVLEMFDGGLEFEYDHSVYWPALQKLVEQRRAAYRERWEVAGKRIGEYETYLQGGDHKSLQEVIKEAGGSDDGESLAADIAKLSVKP